MHLSLRLPGQSDAAAHPGSQPSADTETDPESHAGAVAGTRLREEDWHRLPSRASCQPREV